MRGRRIAFKAILGYATRLSEVHEMLFQKEGGKAMGGGGREISSLRLFGTFSLQGSLLSCSGTAIKYNMGHLNTSDVAPWMQLLGWPRVKNDKLCGTLPIPEAAE